MKQLDTNKERQYEIIGEPPYWLMRNGILIFFIVIILIIIGTYFFKYPKIITCPIIITTKIPPVDVIAKSTGRLEKILVKDEQYVKENDILAIIENSSDFENVLFLKEKLKYYSIENSIDTFPDLFYNLGELQPLYEKFYKNYIQYFNYVNNNYLTLKHDLLEEQLLNYKNYINHLSTQKENTLEEFKILKSQFERDSLLHENGTIAQIAFETTKIRYLALVSKINSSNISFSEANIQKIKLEQELIDYNNNIKLNKEELSQNLYESLENIKSEIDAWSLQYILKSPINGRVSFNKYWSENQNIHSGESVFSIIPNDSLTILGKSYLPFKGSGEVQVGQSINIRLNSFPHLEYGLIKGIVKKISSIPTNDYYIVETELPTGLKTTYGILLPLQYEMKGEADIITLKTSLLNKIFNPVQFVVKNKINLEKEEN